MPLVTPEDDSLSPDTEIAAIRKEVRSIAEQAAALKKEYKEAVLLADEHHRLALNESVKEDPLSP